MRVLTLKTLLFCGVMILFLNSLNAQHTRSCGTDHQTDQLRNSNPDFAEAWEDFHQRVIPVLAARSRANQRSAAPILNIPVVVHVIHSGEAVGTGSNLSAAQIQAQLDVLNEDFAAQNPNFSQTPSQWANVIGSGDINFCLATVDPTGNPTTGITRQNITVTGTNLDDANIEDEIKPATGWNGNNYYNIWTLPIPGTTANGGTVGYAYLPNPFTIGSSYDGTVVDWRWFGGPGFNQSGYKTLTHETGHYLGLPHTFKGDDCGSDDNIDDTPNISAATASLIPGLFCSSNNFPTGPSSCNNEHMFVNYMDYVNVDYCYTSFTFGQIAVMRGVLEGDQPLNYGSRIGLLNNAVTACVVNQNDAGITQVIAPSDGLSCSDATVTPSVEVSNFGTTTLTTFSVVYQINNGAPVVANFIDNIQNNESVTVQLAPFDPPSTPYEFKVYTENPNGVTDENTDNDTEIVNSELVSPQGLPLQETFTTATFNPSANGFYLINPGEDAFTWTHSTIGNTAGSAIFDNYEGTSGDNPTGTIDALVSPVLNTINTNGLTLTFDVAYARYQDGNTYFNDSLKIYLSTDCGSNFNQIVFTDGGASLETGTATSVLFQPTPNEWATKTIDLSNYAGQENLSIAFVNFSGWGNALYLDNINISINQTCDDIALNPVTINPSCYQANDGAINLNPSNGEAPYSYQWSNGGSLNFINQLSANSYNVTVTDASGCSTTNGFVLTEPAVLNGSLSATDSDGNNGTATVIVSGGIANYFYQWSNGGSTATINDLVPGIYSVTVYDNNQCDWQGEIAVEATPVDCSELTLTTTAIHPLCFGNSDGRVTTTPINGQAPYTYQWSNGGSDNMVNNISAGSYGVTVTDAVGCSATGQESLVNPNQLAGALSSTNVTPGAAPANGTASVMATGGTGNYAYVWSNGGNTATINNLSADVYSVSIYDDHQCHWSGEIEVERDEVNCTGLAQEMAVSAVSCNGMSDGTAMVSATGGAQQYTYQWSNGSTNVIINNLAAGVYQVTVTDILGCEVIAEANITEPASLSSNLNASSDPCLTPGGILTVAPTGGNSNYQVQWSNGMTGNEITVMESGQYSVTVTDGLGCTAAASTQIIASNSIMELAVSTEAASCAGDNNGTATAMINGGTPPYSYIWNTGSINASITDLAPGNYMVEVTDGLGCRQTRFFSIDGGVPIILNCTGTEATAGNNGFVQVSGSGGHAPYQYTWNTGATGSFVQGLENGFYTVTVTDQNGCAEICNVMLETTATEGIEDLSRFILFPNPTNQHLNVSGAFSETTEAQLSLYNLMGQQVWKADHRGSSFNLTIDLVDLSAGTYIFVVATNQGRKTEKVVKF